MTNYAATKCKNVKEMTQKQKVLKELKVTVIDSRTTTHCDYLYYINTPTFLLILLPPKFT